MAMQSLRLNTGKPDDLGPFDGLLGNEFAEVSGRSRQHHAAERGKTRLDLGIG